MQGPAESDELGLPEDREEKGLSLQLKEKRSTPGNAQSLGALQAW
jgi:hypothetical protein